MSLLASVRTRLLDKLGSISSAWKTLVVDDHTHLLLDQVLGDNEILNLNYTVIDSLQSARQPDPSLPAVYLLLPTTQNVHRILADFPPPTRRGYKEAHVVFLDVAPDSLVSLLAGGLSTDTLKRVEEVCLNFWPREDRVFLSRQPWSTFTLYGQTGSQLQSEIAMDAFEDDLCVMSRTITNLLIHLSEDPLIRYYAPAHHGPLGPLSSASPSSGSSAAPSLQSTTSSGGASGERWRSALSARSSALGSGGARSERFTGEGVSKRLAEAVGKEVEGLKVVDETLFTPKAGLGQPSRPKATLFIVDRSIDPVAPWPHEFTYQAMVTDLLALERDGLGYKYDFLASHGQTEKKEAVLTESDSVWRDVRHLHMRDAIDRLMGDFNGFLKENGGFQARKGAATLNDMKDMLADLPQFQEMREKFSLHLSMAQTSMDLFEKKRLNDTGMVEQNCATGVTPEGKTPKSLVEDMIPLLGENESVVTRLDKVRIVALYIMYKDGVPDEDRRRLFQHAKLNVAEQDAINNLVLFGQKVVKNPGDRDGKKRIKQKSTGQEDEYELSRFKPVVRTMLEDHVSNRLDSTTFPYVGDSPEPTAPPSTFRALPAATSSPTPSASGSLRSQRPNWHRAGTTQGAGGASGGGGGAGGEKGGREQVRQRLIVFVAGGVTYSEMRSAYLVGKATGKEIIIGSTHIITPELFIKDLKSLGKSGIGARPPNLYPLDSSFPLDKVQPPKNQAERYQVVLDKMHWTTFVPPKAVPQAALPPPASSGRLGKMDRDVRMQSPSPGPSSSTSGSNGHAPPAKEEKKKKKGFLSRF